MSCYDYRTQRSCVKDNCGAGCNNNGAWNTAGATATSDVTGEDSTADRRTTAMDTNTLTCASDEWFDWNITDAVQNWVNGSWSEYGLEIVDGTIDRAKSFYSTEFGLGGNPYVEVNYSL